MKGGYKVKLCGTTNMADMKLAAQQGADYFGTVIEVDFSPRSLAVEAAAELFAAAPLPAVALVYQMPEARLKYLIQTLNPFAVQFLSQDDLDRVRRLHQDFPKVQLWQSIHLPALGEPADLEAAKIRVQEYIQAGIDLLLYDTVATVAGQQKFGGTGRVSDWSAVRRLMAEIKCEIPVFLAGGINPGNVAQALTAVNPDGVDLCSGVEAVAGQKDPEKVARLMSIVRAHTRDEVIHRKEVSQ